MKIPDLQTDFSAGQLSRKHWTRVDSDLPSRGAALLRNVIVTDDGGLKRAPGTFLDEVLDSGALSPLGLDPAECQMILVPYGYHSHYVIVFYPSPSDPNASGYALLSVSYAAAGERKVISLYAAHGDGAVDIRDNIVSGGSVTGTATVPRVDFTKVSVADVSTPVINAQASPRAVLVGPGLRPLLLDGYSNNKLTHYTDFESDIRYQSGNEPLVATNFEGRLVLIGTGWYPNRIRMSRSGDPRDFDIPSDPGTWTSDTPLEFDIAQSALGEPVWAQANETLTIGFTGAEVGVKSYDGAALDYTNISANVYSRFGSHPSGVAATVGDAIIFVDSGGKGLREYMYSNERQAYLSPDISSHASDIFDSEIVSMAVQYRPYIIIWMVLESGKLVGCTYNKTRGVLAYHEHFTQGKYLSVIVAPHPLFADRDAVAFLVARDFDDDPAVDNFIYIEHLAEPLGGDEAFGQVYTHATDPYSTGFRESTVKAELSSYEIGFGYSDQGDQDGLEFSSATDLQPPCNVRFFNHNATDAGSHASLEVNYDSGGYSGREQRWLYETTIQTITELKGPSLGYCRKLLETSMMFFSSQSLAGARVELYVDGEYEDYDFANEFGNLSFTVPAEAAFLYYGLPPQQAVVKTVPVMTDLAQGMMTKRSVRTMVSVENTAAIEIGADDNASFYVDDLPGLPDVVGNLPMRVDKFVEVMLDSEYGIGPQIVIKSKDAYPLNINAIYALIEGSRR